MLKAGSIRPPMSNVRATAQRLPFGHGKFATADSSQRRQEARFGSDYPLITPDRWLRDFEALPIKDEVRPLVLKDNAARLLGL